MMERHNTETGYTEIYYFDSNGETTTKEKATEAIIRELDQDGNLIQETRGSIRRNALNFQEKMAKRV